MGVSRGEPRPAGMHSPAARQDQGALNLVGHYEDLFIFLGFW
jgi:hypothetical protein